MTFLFSLPLPQSSRGRCRRSHNPPRLQKAPVVSPVERETPPFPPPPPSRQMAAPTPRVAPGERSHLLRGAGVWRSCACLSLSEGGALVPGASSRAGCRAEVCLCRGGRAGPRQRRPQVTTDGSLTRGECGQSTSPSTKDAAFGLNSCLTHWSDKRKMAIVSGSSEGFFLNFTKVRLAAVALGLLLWGFRPGFSVS